MSQARSKKKFRIAGFRRVPRRSMLAGLRSGVLGLLLRRGTVSCPLIIKLLKSIIILFSILHSVFTNLN